MAYSKVVFDVVAEMLEELVDVPSEELLRVFDDMVIALALDSGLSERVVQSQLVDAILEGTGKTTTYENVVLQNLLDLNTMTSSDGSPIRSN